MSFSGSTKPYRMNKPHFLSRIFSIAWDTPSYLRMLGVLITPEIRAVILRNWKNALIPLRHNFLSLGLPRRTRIRLMTHHYNYIRSNLSKYFLKRICREMMTLWEENRNNISYRIVLSIPPSIKEQTEGNLTLVFKADLIDVFTLSFTICPGHFFGLTDSVMYIGRLQGVRDKMDLVKISTKNCKDTAPQTILLAVAEGICLSLGIRNMVCPSSKAQLSLGRQDEPTNRVSIYDQFWIDNGATRLGEETFCLPVPMPHKPTNHIKRSHRSRANSRRKYREFVSNIAKTSFCKLFKDCHE
jgi:uncharacterized protein VirK/YbjX